MSDSLRIGLVQCGHIHPELIPKYGDYPEAFAHLLAAHDLELVTYDVQTGPVPGPTACDGWLISGSASSAYEHLEWIPTVERFLRTLVEREAPLVAVCFGHQLLAQALGGRVERAQAGWGAGAHDYQLVGPTCGVDRPPDGTVRLIASHQDQVTMLPDGAKVVARTDHCPIAAFTIGDHALALQPHPEFTAALSGRLVALRRDRIGTSAADAALATLDRPLDSRLVAAWMDSFWRR